MGLTQEEYEALSEKERKLQTKKQRRLIWRPVPTT